MFSKHVGIKESNEVEVMAVSEALHLIQGSFQGKLIVESDSSNVVMWVLHARTKPWRFQFHLNKIRELSSCMGAGVSS